MNSSTTSLSFSRSGLIKKSSSGVELFPWTGRSLSNEVVSSCLLSFFLVLIVELGVVNVFAVSVVLVVAVVVVDLVVADVVIEAVIISNVVVAFMVVGDKFKRFLLFDDDVLFFRLVPLHPDQTPW